MRKIKLIPRVSHLPAPWSERKRDREGGKRLALFFLFEFCKSCLTRWSNSGSMRRT